MSVIIGFNPVNYKKEDRKIAQETAINVLSKCPKGFFPIAVGFGDDGENEIVKNQGFYTLNLLKRDSQKEIGNNRRLPYVKEIFNLLSNIECNVFGFINSDILLNNETYEILSQDFDAYIFPRYEIKEVKCQEFINGEMEIVHDKHPGADGFFFNKKWWLDNRDIFHDNLILGEQQWDNIYRDKIKEASNNYIEKRVLYHVKHVDGWGLEGVGAENNGKIWFEHWERKFNGVVPEWDKWEKERLERVKGVKK